MLPVRSPSVSSLLDNPAIVSIRSPPNLKALPATQVLTNRVPTHEKTLSTPPNAIPTIRVLHAPNAYAFDVALPSTILPEMVTISAKKGNKLRVIADAWHLEDNCHYEWEIAFAPYDVDMASVKAKFEPGGRLLITVARR
ncbi:hypothetical protein K523DRAFT_245227 [Schizophyllum commune Tattone D]|nr:hypothetical protein K523DRAFT_245227 [Schizophyllum commune Tattone D]